VVDSAGIRPLFARGLVRISFVSRSYHLREGFARLAKLGIRKEDPFRLLGLWCNRTGGIIIVLLADLVLLMDRERQTFPGVVMQWFLVSIWLLRFATRH
jgi:hypothetical protein